MSAQTDYAIVSAELFGRACRIAPDYFARAAIQGVRIEPCAAGGALIVATDGLRLVVFRDPRAVVTKALTFRPNKPFRRAARQSYGEAAVVVSGPRAALIGPPEPNGPVEEDAAEFLTRLNAPDDRVWAYQWRDVLSDVDYPAWRNVIPAKFEPNIPLPPLDVKLTRGLSAALDDADGARSRLIASGSDPRSPVWVCGPKRGLEGFGIIIGVAQMQPAPDAAPEWLSLEAAP